MHVWTLELVSHQYVSHTHKKKNKNGSGKCCDATEVGTPGVCVTQTARLKTGLITSASEPILLPACKGQHVTCEAGSVHVVAHCELQHITSVRLTRGHSSRLVCCELARKEAGVSGIGGMGGNGGKGLVKGESGTDSTKCEAVKWQEAGLI